MKYKKVKTIKAHMKSFLFKENLQTLKLKTKVYIKGKYKSIQ